MQPQTAIHIPPCFMQPDAKRAIDVIKYGVITVTPQSRLYQVLACIVDLNISGLPVVDKSMHLEGIITEKDLMPYFYGDNLPPSQVGEIMTTDITTFSPEDSVLEICGCLLHNNFRRVPIIKDGVLVGLISRADVIRYILRNLTRLRHYRALQKVNEMIP